MNNKIIFITKKFEFSASHRYWREEWSEEQNNQKFGKCTSLYGHGHNYELHVTVSGRVDTVTGMIINLTDLKKHVNIVIEKFDHKFLNLDTPYFKTDIPTTENITKVNDAEYNRTISSLAAAAAVREDLHDQGRESDDAVDPEE